MNTKEAIEFLENELKIHEEIYEAFGIPEMVKEKSDVKNAINNYQNIITLLKQGEKYRQMWEELRDNRPRPIGTYWEKYINRLEQKYFPKENIKEVVKGVTEQIIEGAEIARKEAESDEA